ncbi:hypothetical protein HB820_03430 [Listeria booriae]|uniref:hypothetical protein n=1 Tax=Listeria booriae TaxID=1552123 RepID=UPI0016280D7B|nr:hypothetical protein [Listeria booriae]MBC1334333.1 hypothetical protein [Listeria booriae]
MQDRFKRAITARIKIREELKEIDIFDIISKRYDIRTLRITRNMERTKYVEGKLINAFLYTYMRNKGIPMKVSNISDVFEVERFRNGRANTEFDAPKLIYNNLLIDYYNRGLAADDEFVSFISYYHIIEYYLDEVFNEQLISNVKNIITRPDFSYKNNKKIKEIIDTLHKDMRMVKDNGGGNEKQALTYVLNKYLKDIDKFKLRIGDSYCEYYRNTRVPFSKGAMIDWSNKIKIIDKVVDRIYTTRNSLVHNKSGKKDSSYNHNKDKQYLKMEIPLVKAIAEIIIEDSAQEL